MVLQFVQRRFGRSFEVIISKGDFAQTSHYHGDLTCKYKKRKPVAMRVIAKRGLPMENIWVMAYATPVQVITLLKMFGTA